MNLHMNMESALIWGFFSTIVLTTILASGREFGFTRMDIPFILGTMFTSHRDRAKWIGFFFHLLLGWAFALLYISAIEVSGIRHWWFGTFIGLVHAGFVLMVVATILPSLHPRMASEEWGPDPNRLLEPPGSFGLNYGRRTPLVTLFAHLVYGGIIGLFY